MSAPDLSPRLGVYPFKIHVADWLGHGNSHFSNIPKGKSIKLPVTQLPVIGALVFQHGFESYISKTNCKL